MGVWSKSAGKLLVYLSCYAICLCHADGVCFISLCVACKIFHYRKVILGVV